MRWQDRVFQNFKVYAVTDLTKPDLSILRKVEAAYQNGVDIVQLRSHTLSMSDKVQLGKAIRKLSLRMKKLYFVNDSLDLALLTNADGLHVGQEDMSPAAIRSLCRKFGTKLYLGLSTHSQLQAKESLKQPIDYFGVGPVFKTPTKPGYTSVGLKLLEQVSSFATKPWVAIGGINDDNLQQILEAGATRVAVVRAIFDSKNPADASRRIVKQMNTKI